MATYKTFAISSGHGKYIRGAVGYLDEVDEARRVVDRVAEMLRGAGVARQNVPRQYEPRFAEHQPQYDRKLAQQAVARARRVSVHFNAYQTTSKPMGTECLYKTQEELSADVASGIADATGLPNRGREVSQRFEISEFNTSKPAVLVETCFVDAKADEERTSENFDDVCQAIAEALTGRSIGDVEPPPVDELPAAG